MQSVYSRLLNDWLTCDTHQVILKTDLYDEAVSNDNVVSLLDNQKLFAMDLSYQIARKAQKRIATPNNTRRQTVVTDVKSTAFRSNCFDWIFSNSTLDHFKYHNEIVLSLNEIHRILKPKGKLIITMDNPSNPLIRIRNRSAYGLMKRTGIIPYFMGATFNVSQLISVLKSIGFQVTHQTAIVHSPRIIAIRTGQIIDKIGSQNQARFFSKILNFFEGLEKFSTRYLTGHFIAVKAVKQG